MGINKVNYGNTTLIDISEDTVTAGSMLSGTTAHDNSGAAITGTIASKSSSDLTASGATVTVPAGYYASQASKAVASGSAGTPTATKGTVSNHAVSVTPSVTNTTGYITGSTKTGTAVTVSASELVSGDLAITSNGTGIDVATYSTVSVNVSSSANLREIEIVPSEETQVITPDAGTYLGTCTSEVASISASGTSYSGSFKNKSGVSIDSTTVYVLGGEYYLTNSTGSNIYEHGFITGQTYLQNKNLVQYIDVDYTSASGDTYLSEIKVIKTSSSTTLWLTASQVWQSGGKFTLSLQVYEVASPQYDGFSRIVVGAMPAAGIGTATVTNSSASNTSLAFSGLSGEPKAFFVRCLSQLTRSSSYSYYYITAIRYDGTDVKGNYWRMSNGTFYVDTSHYSFSYSNGTLTVSSSGARGSSGGSFYNGDYELTYIY